MRPPARTRLLAVAALLGLAPLAACGEDAPAVTSPPAASPTTPATSPATSGSTSGSVSGSAPSPSADAGARASPTAPPATPRPPRADPDDVRRATGMAAVRRLAGEIGPRPGTSPAYFEAAAHVQRQLERHGWTVSRQRFRTPAGNSWGIDVPAGPSVNLLATRGDLRPGERWLVVGAHLDTVPQAPGAEDNASGIGALLAVAEAVADRRTRLPVMLVAFGSEEPRGPTDDDHHYGSRAFVDRLTARQRDSLVAMLSLDRVGVGDVVPVCTAGGPTPQQRELLEAAERAGVPAVACEQNRTSDHWSFVRNGLPGARLGDTDYAAYHSPADVPSVVDPAQVERAARITVAWLR